MQLSLKLLTNLSRNILTVYLAEFQDFPSDKENFLWYLTRCCRTAHSEKYPLIAQLHKGGHDLYIPSSNVELGSNWLSKKSLEIPRQQLSQMAQIFNTH